MVEMWILKKEMTWDVDSELEQVGRRLMTERRRPDWGMFAAAGVKMSLAGEG